jgi:energy-coupling factor transport system ATP-binding protein
MEQLALPPGVMRKRVEETIDLLGLADLRRRPLRDLSGGQQQRVAIGAVFTTHPRVLVLDEPTSALDPTAAEEVLATITRLVHDLGVTVVLAEHRLERVLQYADRLIHLRPDGSVDAGDPATVIATSTVAPPVVELGRLAGWSPLPLSVRDARRVAGPLHSRLGAPPTAGDVTPTLPSVVARDVVVRYGATIAVHGLSLSLRRGEVTALMGRNGAGKSSLLWALQGSGRRDRGQVHIWPTQPVAGGSQAAGIDPATLDPAAARALVGLVPQQPADLLYLDTVAAECARADADGRPAAGADPQAATCQQLLGRLAPGIDPARHPRDLSEGQRLALVLALQLSAGPSVLLLDEPTRGLDYGAKRRLGALLRELATAGRTVVISTHDVEFVAETADRVVVLGDGEVVADGPTSEVVVASPSFAPQVAKVLAPQRFLTVAHVRDALVAS